MAYPYNQSFNGGRPSIRIRILVVDDDAMSLNVVATTLRSLNYEVLTAKHPFEALSTLRLMRGGIDLVVSDYHMPDMNGVQLQKKILEEFKIPVIMISVDNREYVMVESLRGGAKIFMVKPIHVEKVENVWQYVVAEKSPSTLASRIDNYPEIRDSRPVSFSISCNRQKEDSKHKNQKVVWTNALHTLFLQAINQIGLEKAVPKKILDLMNVPGLTRQHVASHLQKYRIFLKKVADRGLVKLNDPQKALNDAFELTMTSNAQYHDMILSMPPSQFAKAPPKFGCSSSSVISIGNNQNGGFPLASSSTLSRPTWTPPNTNTTPQSRINMFHQENNQAIAKPFQSQKGIGSSAKNMNSAWNGNPNSSCNIQNGIMNRNEHQYPTRLGLNNQIGFGIPANEHVGLSSMCTYPNNSSFSNQIGLRSVLENEPTCLGFNSMKPNPNNITSDNQFPSRLGFSRSYKPDSGCDIKVDSANGALVYEKGKNLMEPKISRNCYINKGEISSFNVNGPNQSTKEHESTSNELETTILPPPTLGDGEFDDLDQLELLLPQSIGDIDMALESAPLPFDEQLTTNESGDQNWDDEFIGSLLVDDGPYIEADQSSCVIP